MPDATTSEPAEFLAKLKPGEKLAGCYLLQKRIEGAGERPVWLAHDEVLGKDVALHFLPPSLLKRDGVAERIKGEVRRNRQLINPGIIRAIDFIAEDDWAAIATEPFEGKTLATLLLRGGRKFREAAEVQPWIEQLCTVLEQAHKLRLAHGGLTLDDVVVDEKGKVRVMGFGVSAALRDALRGQVDDAANAALLFASPQQIERQPATAADDVFSVGALAHTLLVGESPFPPGTKRGAVVTLSEHRKRLKQDGTPIPAAWEKTIASCLAGEPGQRPVSPTAVTEGFRASGEVAPAAAATSAAAIPAVESRLAESKPAEAKSAAKKVDAPEPVEAKAPDAKPVEAKAPDAKPVEAKASDAKPVEAKAPDAKPVEAKASDAKPVEAKAPDAKPASAPTGKVEEKAPERTEAKPEPKPEPATPSGKGVPDREAPKEPSKGAAAPAVLAGAAGAVAIASKGAEATAEPVQEKRPDESKGRDYGPAKEAERRREAERQRIAEKLRESEKQRRPQPRGEGEEKMVTAVRRDEQAAPQRTRRYDDEEEEYGYGDGGGSGQKFGIAAIGIVLAVLAIFAIGRLFFGNSSSTDDPTLPGATPTPTSSSTPASTPPKATPEPPKLTTSPGIDDAKIASATPPLPAKTEENTEPKAPTSEPSKPLPIATSPPAEPSLPKATDEPPKSAGDSLKKQKELETELTTKKKTLAEMAKALPVLQKAAEENPTAAKKREDDAVKAEKAARAAEEAAELKKKAAEEARKNAIAATEVLQVKKDAHAKAIEELAQLQKEVQEQDKALAELRKANAEAQRTSSPATTQPDSKVQETVDENLQKFRQMQLDLEKKLKGEGANSKPGASDGQGSKIKLDEELPIKPLLPEPTELARNDPPKLADVPEKPSEEGAKSEKSNFGDGYVNSLGMKFVAVRGTNVLFAIWPTRVRDFEVFAKATGLRSRLWIDSVGFNQGPNHPVVNVTWMEAAAFCKWLTIREQKDGTLPADQMYRLPGDLEWSRAVGLPDEAGSTPERRDMSVPDVYPWGTSWPPPPGAGNYTGEETGSDVAIKGYNDGFPWTSPVGSFPANKAGLFDMGGNVWQWTNDTWNTESKAKALRGASWYNGALKLSLLSSCRVHAAPDSGTDNYGFRVVIAPADPDTSKPKR